MPERSKVSVVEPIPNAFVEFLSEVHSKILAREKEALIESDDLLQCEHAFGGLVDKDKRLFGFQLFVGGDDRDLENLTWDFLLEEKTIAQIVSGKVSRMQMWRCHNDCGRRATVKDWYCPECDFLS